MSCDVLIVENDRDQLDEFAELLTSAGLRVATAHNGEQGAKLAGFAKPRVALIDFKLPDMVGTHLAGRIKALSPMTCIVVVSGKIGGLSSQELVGCGAQAFINKPMPPAIFRQAMLRLVRHPPRSRGAHRDWLASGLEAPR